jgi:hypothetical protein
MALLPRSCAKRPPGVKEIEKAIETIRMEKEAAIKVQDYERQPRCEILNSRPKINWSEA